jgi:hypothetical protein
MWVGFSGCGVGDVEQVVLVRFTVPYTIEVWTAGRLGAALGASGTLGVDGEGSIMGFFCRRWLFIAAE